MLAFVEGVYQDGKVELLGPAPDRAETQRVVVTFQPDPVGPAAGNLTQQQAVVIRARAGGIAADWNDPAMDVYDEL